MIPHTILGIDPGNERSAWVLLRRLAGVVDVIAHALEPNDVFLRRCRMDSWTERGVFPTVAVIEQVESMGMAVGREVFETVYLSGRAAEALEQAGETVHRITRREVKLRLCGTSRAKDPNVRQAVLDRFGGSSAKGTKRDPGPLYGIRADEWAALAVGLAWWQQQDEPQR